MNDLIENNPYNAPQADLGVSATDSRKYAGFWFRVLAAFIDGILFSILTLILVVGVGFGAAVFSGEDAFSDGSAIGLVYMFVSYVLPFFITVVLWVKYGGTPGKRMLGLRIIDERTGKHLSSGKSIARYFAYVLSMLLLGLGCIWVAFDKKKKGLHDHITGSIVVIDKVVVS